MYSVGFWGFFSPNCVAFWDYKTPHRPTCERVSYCVETSPSWLPPQGRSPSLTILYLFLSSIFCPTSFSREWDAFLGAWYPLPVFRICFVEVAQHSNHLLMNLRGRKWSPHAIPPPSWRSFWLCGSEQIGKFLKRWEYQTTWPASWEICMQVKKQQLELDMEQQTGSK